MVKVYLYKRLYLMKSGFLNTTYMKWEHVYTRHKMRIFPHKGRFIFIIRECLTYKL